MTDYYQQLYELIVQSRTDFDRARYGNKKAQQRLRRMFRQFRNVSDQSKKFWKDILKKQPKKTRKKIQTESQKSKVYKVILSDIKKWKGISLNMTIQNFIANYGNDIPSLMIKHKISFTQQDFELATKKLIEKKLLIVKEDGLLWVSDSI